MFLFCWMFLNESFTYVRTEVNYTEEVDDPIDSDGEWTSHHPACIGDLNLFIGNVFLFNHPVLLSNTCRRSFGFWEFGVQHLWVCPHAAGEQQVQGHREESPARAHLLHHPVHADHRRPGEDWPQLTRLNRWVGVNEHTVAVGVWTWLLPLPSLASDQSVDSKPPAVCWGWGWRHVLVLRQDLRSGPAAGEMKSCRSYCKHSQLPKASGFWSRPPPSIWSGSV